MSTLLALGDSFSCGEGVGLRVPPEHTWVGQLAAHLGLQPQVLASPGARVSQVRQDQLPQIPADPPTLTTLLVGLNDVIRGGFDPQQVAADYATVVDRLLALRAPLLLVRLHDPTLQIPLPETLRSRVSAPIRSRLELVNDVIAVHAQRRGVLGLDLGDVHPLRQRSAWAVDRIHPSIAGHSGISQAAAQRLQAQRLQAQPWTDDRHAGAASPGMLAQARWLLRHATPWLVANMGEVTIPVARMLCASTSGFSRPQADWDAQRRRRDTGELVG